MFELPALPYDINALEPYISKETLEYHHGKHHKTYIDNLNKLIQGTEYEKMSLEEIVKAVVGKPDKVAIFNNAAQSWNHEFFWNIMKKNGGGKPTGEILKKIEQNFGSYEKFREEFKNVAVSQFGSGWVWLIEKDGKLAIVKTPNADTPIAQGLKPIIVIDVWEHAYYIDYRNRRADFIDAYLDHLVKW